MRKLLMAAAVICLAGQAHAQGLGGVVDGFLAAQEMENQRRAIESGNQQYEAMVTEQRLRRMQRLLEEQNKMLRDREYYRPLRP